MIGIRIYKGYGGGGKTYDGKGRSFTPMELLGEMRAGGIPYGSDLTLSACNRDHSMYQYAAHLADLQGGAISIGGGYGNSNRLDGSFGHSYSSEAIFSPPNWFQLMPTGASVRPDDAGILFPGGNIPDNFLN